MKIPAGARRCAKTATALLMLGLAVGAVSLAPTAAGQSTKLKPRPTPTKPKHAKIQEGYSTERLHLKFNEGTGVRVRGNRFVSQSGANVSNVNNVLNRYPGTRIDRLFERPEAALTADKARIEKKSGREQADKNLWYRLVLRPGTNAVGLIDDLNALALVEIAYAEPLPARSPVTPDFTDQQVYREAATDGIDADFAETVPGGTGSNVRVIDLEYSWNQSHEDLSKAGAALIANGTPADPFSDNNHGTAVLGEIISDDNSFGVTGTAHGAALGLVNVSNDDDGYDLADAIDLAADNLNPGDVIIIEQQTAGAHGGCGSDQTGCVAVEWVSAYYDAIVSATDDGIIVLEAAGNGSEDLDDDDYGDTFPDDRDDSSAIIVGAGSAPGCTDPEHSRLGFSSFGSRVNVQGWGECVVTTGYGDLQGGPMNEFYTNSFGGTSSATPIVTGAAAVVSSVAQQQGVSFSPQQVRSLLMSTGTSQDTSTDTGHIGPLPNLRAALDQAFIPDADTGGPYTVAEGATVTVNGSGSSDPQGSALTYEWDLDNDGQYDDATGVTATFDNAGQDGPHTIGLRVTDPAGASGTDTGTVNVTNVAPTTSVNPIAASAENTTATTVTGTVSDPGWLEPLTATVSWGDGTTSSASGSLENNKPNATLTFSASHTYGDNGTFAVEVCGHDDDTQTCVTTSAVVNNVNPTSTIDKTGATSVNGQPTVIAHAGDSVPFSGRSTDPGSDDLILTWNWADGTPNTVTTYFNNGSSPDPFPSPSIHPRDVTDTHSHTFGDACAYQIAFSAADDDSGASTADTLQVIIAGNATTLENAGYWQTQYRPRPTAFTEAQRQCYLLIVGWMSKVFDEARNAATVTAAFDVLSVSSNSGSATQQLDRQLLAAWLNFANGSFNYGQLVDTNRDKTPDTAFSAVMSNAETIRLNPGSTDAQLRAQRDLLERING
jgi:serine protease